MLMPRTVEETAALSYLGPAEVIATHGHELCVRIGVEHEVRARMALAFPYRPAEHDLVLVVGHADAYYVIGVLKGSGETVLECQGDVALRAVEGTLSLSGDHGVRVEGPEVEFLAEKMRIMVHTLVQKSTRTVQRVRDLMTFRAGRVHSVVDGASYSKSKTAMIVSDEKVMINGKQIYLG